MEDSGEITQQSIDNAQDNSSLKEGSISSEDLARCDKDILTMSALHGLAQGHNAISVISGGYAVEAHCGGVITRPHRDMDIHFYSPNLLPTDTVLGQVQTILQADNPQWRSEEKNPNKKYQFDEILESEKKGRRLELSLDLSSPAHGHETKTLVDSNGNKHEVLVPPVAEVVTGKVIILGLKNAMTPEEKAADKRPTKLQDIKDFQRLLALPTFDQSECIDRLTGYVRHRRKQQGETISSEEAKILAQEEWSKTMEYINGFETSK